MPGRQVAHKLYAHATWCTEKKAKLIEPDIERILKSIIKDTCHEMGHEIIALETLPDHVHLLIRFHPKHQLSNLVKTIKGRTSRLITRQTGKEFKWQKGYGINTVGIKALKDAKDYVNNQKERHLNTETQD